MPQNSVGPQDIKRLIMEGVQAVIFLKKHHQESGMVTLQVFDPEAKVGDEKIGCDEYQQLEPRDAVEIVRRHKELRKKILEAREQQENKETREELARTRRARSPEPPRTYTRKASDSQGNHAPSMLPPPPTPPTPPAPPSLPAAPPQYSTPVAQLALPAIPMQPTTSTMQPAAQVQAAGLNSALLSMLTGAQPMAPNTMGPGANLLQLLSLMQNIPPQLLQQLTQAQAGMMSMMPQANATPVTTMPGFSQAQMTPQGILTTVPASLSSTQPSSMPHPLAPVSSLATSVNGYVTQTPSQPSAPQQAPQPTQQFSQQQQQQQQLQQQPSQPPPPPQQQQQAPQSSIPLHQAAPQQSQSVEGKEAEAPVAQSPSQSNQNNSRVADILKQLALLQKQSPTQR
ncbi:hypothetical protein BGW41_006218 [Actinomortierella wolfii]|nr:hypothetical protein BGW41_006218 [Actinomortierella wolfii]